VCRRHPGVVRPQTTQRYPQAHSSMSSIVRWTSTPTPKMSPPHSHPPFRLPQYMFPVLHHEHDLSLQRCCVGRGRSKFPGEQPKMLAEEFHRNTTLGAGKFPDYYFCYCRRYYMKKPQLLECSTPRIFMTSSSSCLPTPYAMIRARFSGIHHSMGHKKLYT
jgi:hypothetical protein